MPYTWDPTSVAPEEALDRLVRGNQRFLQKTNDSTRRGFNEHQGEAPQRPFAIVLGCSDSRTPVEILFDQGFGDLFVVRIAGNIVAPSVVGSIEFAASQFGTRLVVVLGHTQCGAIGAAAKEILTGEGPLSANIRSITSRIVPHIQELVHPTDNEEEHRAILRRAMRANVHASVDHLRHGSRILETLVLAKRLVVLGAEYELSTGVVHFFE